MSLNEVSDFSELFQIASEFLIGRCLDQAAREVESLGSQIPEASRKDLEFWWAAHLISMTDPERQIDSGSAAGLSYSHAKAGNTDGLKETTYGRNAQAIIDRYAGISYGVYPRPADAK